ncbi:hypothetical protein SK128_011959 [Halocaridina rubra]|uniref:Uncharacterized protein n=1 Tax=Halocaridina rubra TaxID=373956 RepID=A0AAN8WUM7_HALRR
MFADDAKIVKKVKNENNGRELQEDLNNLHEWSEKMSDPDMVSHADNEITSEDTVISIIISQIVTAAIALVTSKEETPESAQWARETADLVSRVLSIGIDSFDSSSWTSGWLSLMLGTGWYSLTFLTIPVVLTGIMWYFILTFLLKINVAGIFLGKSLDSSAGIFDLKHPDYLDHLTQRISTALDQSAT